MSPLSRLLLKWYRQHGRTLPWRDHPDPYAVWVSEIMLQQTQVKTVIPYYKRWMKNFPTLRRLAEAPLSSVLKAWEGLGYYSRARNLHQAAKIVTNRRGGRLPGSAEELRRLPGIGRYTAGAIASIAFNQAEPVLDGNVKRVLARVFGSRTPVDTPSGEKQLWKTAENLVRSLPKKIPGFNPGDWNQALMELGALVCLPENPRCLVCPIEKSCRAHRLGKETEFPVKARRVKTQKLKTVAAVIWKNGRVLLEKQPLRARWGGLWVFPQWTHTNGKSETTFLAEKVKRELGITVDKFQPKMEIKHGFTKYRISLRTYEGKTRSFAKPPSGRRFAQDDERRSVTRQWVNPKNLFRLPCPSAHQKIAEAILHA